MKEFLSPVCRQLQGYDISTLAHAGDMTWEIESNWKFIYENYIEPYHVPWCHPSLESFTPANQHWFSVDGPCFVNRAEFSAGEAGRGAGLPYLPHLSTKLRQRGTYIHLFPSCCLNLYPDHLAVFLLTPLSSPPDLRAYCPVLPRGVTGSKVGRGSSGSAGRLARAERGGHRYRRETATRPSFSGVRRWHLIALLGWLDHARIRKEGGRGYDGLNRCGVGER